MAIFKLKSIKISRSLSEDSLAYTADVYLDGKLVGSVKDQGMGGGTNFTGEVSILTGCVAAFQSYYKDKNNHRNDPEWEKFKTLYDDLNVYGAIAACADAIAYDKDAFADARKYRTKHTAFIAETDQLVSIPKRSVTLDQFKTAMANRYPEHIFKFAEDMSDGELFQYLFDKEMVRSFDI